MGNKEMNVYDVVLRDEKGEFVREIEVEAYDESDALSEAALCLTYGSYTPEATFRVLGTGMKLFSDKLVRDLDIEKDGEFFRYSLRINPLHLV